MNNGLLILTLNLLILTLFLPFIVDAQVPDKNLMTQDDDVELIISQAKSGDAEAQFSYAMMLDMGDRVAMDKQAAITWYQKAALQGLPAACLYLGMKYEFGNTVEQDAPQAIHWYREAAMQNWPDAQFHLGRVLLERGRKKEEQIEAAAWLSLAVEWEFPGAEEEWKKAVELLSKQEHVRVEKMRKKLIVQIDSGTQ